MPTLDKNSSISLGSAAIVIVTVVSTTFWLNTRLGGIDAQITQLKSDQYTMAMAAESALRLAINNPGLKVPDPRSPGQIIEVETGNPYTVPQ